MMGHEARVFPHNDLLNLAQYHKGIIEKKVTDDNREAIALDCMSCIIALAFFVEAFFNFVGYKKIPGWKERSNYFDKKKQLEKHLKFDFDPEMEPFKSLETLLTIRNQLAHAKPVNKKAEKSSRVLMELALRNPWDQHLTPEFAQNAYAQVIEFQGKLLALAEIQSYETLTSVSGIYQVEE